MEWPKAVALCFHQTWYSPPWRAHLLLSKCGVGLVSHYGQKVHLSKPLAKTGRPPQNVWGLLRLRNIISALRKQVYWLNETADLQGLYSLWDTVERKSKIQANIYKLPHTIQEASTLQTPM